jgi:hypothetical protein
LRGETKIQELKGGVLLYATSIREIGKPEKWMFPSILDFEIS